MSSFNTSVTQSGDNTLAGGATEATQLQVLAELQKQAEFSETVWVDATGTFFIRRVVYSENLETYTVEYTLADGSTYSPTAPIEPASAGTDRELVVTSYTVVTSGTGYTIGDIVQQINIFNVQSDTLETTIWYNQTTDLTISPAPTIAHLTPEGSIQSIASATGTQADVAYTTGNGTIISLLKGLFGKFGTLGQKNMAGSAPVVIASDQSTIPVSTASLPLPSGAATEATLATRATEVTLDAVKTAVEILDETVGTDGAETPTQFLAVGGGDGHNGYLWHMDNTGAGRVDVTKSDLIGAVTETAPATDTASSGLNGRLQRAAQNLTALTSASGIAIGALTVIRNGVSDGTSWIRLKADANGRLEISPNPIAPTATQTVVQFTVNAAVTVSQNSAATATTGSAGGNWICITNNSGIVCDLTTGGTSGGADGTTICTVIAGDTVSMPFKIAASTVLRIKPTSGNLTTSDYIQVRVS